MPDDTQEPAKPVETEKQTVNTWQQPAPAPQPTPAVAETAAHNSPGILVLQWLTYAFWGWTILALAWLTAISVGFFLNPSADGYYESTIVSYSLAAVIVLFLVSVVCDAFYARVEPLHKTGGAMVIMVIHAVIFALFGIGSLIAAVFGVVRLLIGDGDAPSYNDSGSWTTLITGLFIAVVYGATLLRTLRPFKLKRSGMIYGIFMGLATLVIVVLGVAGPAYSARITRDDRLIERALPQLSEVIRSHAAKADALPKTLSEVRDEGSDDVRTLIDRNLVGYKPGKEITASDMSASIAPDDPERIIPPTSSEKSFAYTLCVAYKAKKGASYYYAENAKYNTTSPDTYQHPAGRVCYDLETSYVGIYY